MGQRIKKNRLMKEWTKTKLAKEINSDISSLITYEQNKRRPKLNTFKELANSLDVDHAWLASFHELPEGSFGQKIRKYRLINGSRCLY
ncbi:helix-turn-helix domain-containing protein [Natroniella sulfidigena]|uniref:helix-turn-helix domain-containing protein n=1 Tax=Natroniella sulfidigena TaxID=723921 RepID=UPI003D09A030